MLTDEELYRGFAPEEREAIRKEARERWGEARVAEKEAGLAALNADLARAMREPVESAVARAAVLRHYAWVSTFWKPDAEAYRGLGRLYVEDPRFKAYYDGVAPGLADFLRRAIDAHAEEAVREGAA